MSRTFIAAVTALAIALIVPAAASAQYSPPFSYPTAVTLPYPPVSGLEVHPFGFGGNWAANSPLEADFAEYIAWRSIESDYRMRAATYDDLTYYTDSGLMAPPSPRRLRAASTGTCGSSATCRPPPSASVTTASTRAS